MRFMANEQDEQRVKEEYEQALREHAHFMQERDRLIDAARESARTFDKAVLTFGSAIFGASIVFLKDVAPNPHQGTLKWLGFSWFCFSTGISILLVRRRKNTPLSARLATFFAFVPTAKPPSCPAGPLPRPKSRDLPDFEAISQTPLPQLPSVVQIGFAWLARLSGRQRQSQNPPQHACEQAPRQVALGQHHPVVPSVLD